MGLKKFEKDMNIIAALDDEPNDVGGLSASQLKEKFDQSGCEIKQYINETLLPALEAETAAAALGVRMPSSSGIEGPGTIQEAIDSLSAVAMNGGAVPSGGLPGQILAKADAEDHHLKWISADAEAFGSYRKEKILSAATKTLFGLGADAVPDDALAFLGKYNQHWWRRRPTSYYEAVVGEYGWEYLQASERNAYPDSGTSGGYEYEYLGIPFENAVTAPKIAAGSYVGTGTYGQSNPNTLEFDAPPLMVFVVGDRSFFAIQGNPTANVIYGGSGGTLSLIWSGNSLSWYVYAEPDAYNQLNIEGKAYYYIALLI